MYVKHKSVVCIHVMFIPPLLSLVTLTARYRFIQIQHFSDDLTLPAMM